MKVPIIADAEDHITQQAVSGSATNVVPAGSVLVVTRSGILRRTLPVAVTQLPVALNQDLKALRPAKGIDARYVAWALRADEKVILHGCSKDGTTVDSIDFPALLQHEIPMAPAREQERIVAAIEEQFSRLDAAVTGLARARRGLDLMRASVIQTAATGSDERAAIGPDRAPSKLPCGWSWQTIQEVSTMVVDGDHNPPKRSLNGVPHLTARNIKNGILVFDGCSFVSEGDFERMRKRYEPQRGDVIVTCVGTLGETAVVPAGSMFSADRNLAAIRPNGAIRSHFLKLVLDAPLWQRQIKGVSGSTAQPHLYLGDLRVMPVPVPPLAVQDQILERASATLSHIAGIRTALEAMQRRAGALHSSILSAAFSGKLVPQDPTDEPASVLLERIAAERPTQQKRRASQPRLPLDEATA